MILYDYQNKEINLPDDRWEHINERHPETLKQEACIQETLIDPDFIQEGTKGELLSIKKFVKTPVSDNKYCVVVYKYSDSATGFVITAYYTRRPSFKRKLIWKK